MKIEKIIPFLSKDDLREVAQNILNGELDLNLTMILPFMNEKDVDDICSQVAENPELLSKVNMAAMYPFASEECIDKIFLAGITNGKTDNAALPFVSDECLHRLVEDYLQNDSVEFEIDQLYPFLDEEDIRLLSKTYIKRHHKKTSDNEK